MALPRTARQEQRNADLAPANVRMMEKHYSYADIAEAWSMSEDFVYKAFRDQPGVMQTPGKRHTGRVPQSVVQRVYETMVVAR